MVKAEPFSLSDNETFLLITSSGDVSHVKIPVGDPHVFNDNVHRLISCTWYELVDIGNGYYLVVDELGKVYDTPKPINPKASRFYLGTAFGDPIVGDVILGKMGTVNGEPDLIGLNSHELYLFDRRLGNA